MNRRIISVSAMLALAISSPAALATAQKPAAPKPAEASASFAPKAAGPTVDANKVGIKQASKATNTAPYEARLGAGRNVALMVVGGAALIIGAIIGGSAGLLIAVGGAAVGLYGLYYFVQ